MERLELAIEPHGLWHFSFTVSDLDSAVNFYTELLGFHFVHRQVQYNEYTRRLVGYPEAVIEIAQLAIPGCAVRTSTHDLELVHYLRPTRKVSQVDIATPGAAHLALAVTDLKAAHERLVRAGVEFVSEPNRITHGVNRGGYAVYFYGPDRIVHELVQAPPRSG